MAVPVPPRWSRRPPSAIARRVCVAMARASRRSAAASAVCVEKASMNDGTEHRGNFGGLEKPPS